MSSGTTLLLSDLHLPADASPLREAFLRFLAGPARTAQTLYILGDLFEYWVGDDKGLRDYAPEVAALHELSARGVRIGFMPGNRDFIAGRRFAAAAGLELLPDPLRVELCGVPTLLSHGDIFCVDDRMYQRWRRFSRNRLAQRIFLAMPLALRERFGGRARRLSAAGRTRKPQAIMDVNPEAVRQAFERHAVPRIIHGHTHRPAEHAVTAAGTACQRIVLADWRPDRLEYLVCDGGGWRRALLDAAP